MHQTWNLVADNWNVVKHVSQKKRQPPRRVVIEELDIVETRVPTPQGRL